MTLGSQLCCSVWLTGCWYLASFACLKQSFLSFPGKSSSEMLWNCKFFSSCQLFRGCLCAYFLYHWIKNYFSINFQLFLLVWVVGWEVFTDFFFFLSFPWVLGLLRKNFLPAAQIYRHMFEKLTEKSWTIVLLNLALHHCCHSSIGTRIEVLEKKESNPWSMTRCVIGIGCIIYGVQCKIKMSDTF